MRLDKYLADMNVGTRTELKRAIRKGGVTVDGEVIKDPSHALAGTEQVCFFGKRIAYETFSYYMMNKPAGVICASEDRRQQTVMDLMENERRRDLFPVGRLDKDTVGLVLLSNDGEMAHRLLSPKFHVDKLYEAQVAGLVTDEDAKKFAKGIRFDEDLVAEPAELTVLSHDKDEVGCEISLVRVVIHEGKFHQIKKMFEAVDKPVLSLKRLSIGPLRLDERLKEGDYRRLTEEELQALLAAAGMNEER